MLKISCKLDRIRVSQTQVDSFQILDYYPTTIDSRRLIPFRSSGHNYIAAQGSSSVVIYDQLGASPKKVIYRQDSQTNLMDLAVAQISSDKALAATADRGLRTFELYIWMTKLGRAT